MSESRINGANDKWLFATNHKNLSYLLASGLVHGKSGFGTKYYTDALDHCADYLPLFRNHVPLEALEVAVSEKSSLVAVVLELNLSQLAGPVLRAVPMAGLEQISYTSEITEPVIFVRAPLPAHWIGRITVATKEDKKTVERDASELLNVPLKSYRLATGKTLLSGKAIGESALALPKNYLPAASSGIANVTGGMLLALSRFSGAGEAGAAINSLAFDVAFADWPASISVGTSNSVVTGGGDLPSVTENNTATTNAKTTTVVPSNECDRLSECGHPVVSESLFASLPLWLRQHSSVEISADSAARMFWSAIDALVQWHNSARRGVANDLVLRELEQTLQALPASVQERCHDFLEDLRDVAGLAEDTVEQMIEAYTTPMERGYLLLLLVKNVEHLYALYREKRYPDLTKADYLAAAILVGSRQGWRATAVEDRGSACNAYAIQHRMALIAHAVTGSGISLGDLPAREPVLYEMLQVKSSGKFTVRQQRAAVMVARVLDWPCVETRITLPDAQVDIVSRSGKMSLTTRAEVQVETLVDITPFNQLLRSECIEPELLEKARAILG